jgi:hypothetical protein
MPIVVPLTVSVTTSVVLLLTASCGCVAVIDGNGGADMAHEATQVVIATRAASLVNAKQPRTPRPQSLQFCCPRPNVRSTVPVSSMTTPMNCRVTDPSVCSGCRPPAKTTVQAGTADRLDG